MVTKAFIVIFFFIGLVTYLGFFTYKRILEVTLASGNTDYYEEAKGAMPISAMTLASCTPGKGIVNLVSSPQIMISPTSARLSIGEKLRIINGDSTPHSISFAYTKIKVNLESGSSAEFMYQNFPKAGSWGIICDDIYLGEKSPTIVISEP